ncbi:MAG: peroxiredoxin [Thermoplasmata archaeon]|nr:peroxiredoxin [Thermoplasmata archaeon]
MVAPGDPAPDFEAPNQDGKPLKLSSLRGHPVVLYFYPAADTPGCTVESKAFRDHYAELQAKGVHVVGVSTDTVDAQCDFAKKYALPFPLVADHSKAISKNYGVLRDSGRARRVTFFIDPKGKVVDVVDAGAPDPHIARAKKLYLAN